MFMRNSQDSGAVYLSLFEKGQGAIGILEFKLLDFRLIPDLGCQGQERSIHLCPFQAGFLKRRSSILAFSILTEIRVA